MDFLFFFWRQLLISTVGTYKLFILPASCLKLFVSKNACPLPWRVNGGPLSKFKCLRLQFRLSQTHSGPTDQPKSASATGPRPKRLLLCHHPSCDGSDCNKLKLIKISLHNFVIHPTWFGTTWSWGGGRRTLAQQVWQLNYDWLTIFSNG